MNIQSGVVMVFALLVLLSITILGVTSVSSSLLQGKMASSIELKSAAFDAAEAAIAGVIFESEDASVFADPVLTDPFTEARQLAVVDLVNDKLSCFDTNRTERAITSEGLAFNVRHTSTGLYSDNPPVNSWSRTAFIHEQSCRGSSIVIGGSNINCHVFMVRGCGQTEGSNYVLANTVTAMVIAPVSN